MVRKVVCTPRLFSALFCCLIRDRSCVSAFLRDISSSSLTMLWSSKNESIATTSQPSSSTCRTFSKLWEESSSLKSASMKRMSRSWNFGNRQHHRQQEALQGPGRTQHRYRHRPQAVHRLCQVHRDRQGSPCHRRQRLSARPRQEVPHQAAARQDSRPEEHGQAHQGGTLEIVNA